MISYLSHRTFRTIPDGVPESLPLKKDLTKYFQDNEFEIVDYALRFLCHVHGQGPISLLYDDYDYDYILNFWGFFKQNLEYHTYRESFYDARHMAPLISPEVSRCELWNGRRISK